MWNFVLSNRFSDLPATFAFLFSFLALPLAYFAQWPHLGMSWKIFALPNLFIKEQYILTSKAPGAEDMTALLEISDNLTVVWEPAFPLANKEDWNELFALRSCRHVALPFYKGPTICLLREWAGRGGYGWFQKKYPADWFRTRKKVKNLPGETFLHWKKICIC